MSNSNHRPHAAHKQRQTNPSAEDLFPGQLPTYLLDPETDEVRELLEELDDAIFGAIGGSEKSLKHAQKLWPRAMSEINPELLEESREQYLLFALEAVERLENPTRRPEHVLFALDIVVMLSSE